MPVRIEIKDHIGELVLAHPPVNAFDSVFWNELPEHITKLGHNEDVRCVLIRAEAKGFCAGVDIKEMAAHPERITLLNRGNFLTFKAIRSCPVPVVIGTHGFVIGGGIGMCGAADVVIASDDCFFSLPEIDRGAMGGAAHLSRMLPLHVVRDLFFSGGRIGAKEVMGFGGIKSVVPRADLEKEVRAYASIIASKSRKALLLAKEALNGIEPVEVDRNYRFEQGFTLELYMNEDSQKARDAFVAGKAPAKF